MPFVFDPADIIASEGPENIGTQFEMHRLSADFHLRDWVECHPNYEVHNHNDESEIRDLIDNESLEFAAATFEVSHDCLHFELESMRILLQEILYAEWPYRQFPHVPYCVLFMCGLALAHALVAERNQETGVVENNVHSLRSSQKVNGISKSVWRTTQNVALHLRSNNLRLALLAGLGISGVWSFYRACKLGTIIWCRYSLDALIKKLEGGQLDTQDVEAMEGPEWRMLWWINIML